VAALEQADGARPRAPSAAGREVVVWDPLVRLFHWGLVAAVTVAFLADDSARLHEGAGYVVLGLLAFRALWGFVGPEHARFADFVPGPRALGAYLRDLARLRPRRYLGHNPAGGLMIVALLLALLVTAGSGWLMTTDRFWGVGWVEELHEGAADVTLALIVVHVAGVVVASLLHRENLVRAMITGRKRA
jgi:cytochrome b